MGEKKKMRLGAWILIILGVIFGLVIFGSFLPDEKEESAPLEYSVIMENPKEDSIGMTVVVDPKTTKEQALKLGQYFQDKYESKKFVNIGIFNNKWAAKNRYDMNIPEEKILKHMLVLVAKNNKTGLKAVDWIKDHK